MAVCEMRTQAQAGNCLGLAYLFYGTNLDEIWVKIA